MYYNTTNIDNKSVDHYTEKAKSQDEAVLSVYERHGILTPSQVWEQLNMPNTPLTSIRRSISSLAKLMKLIKTNKTQLGIYGRPEHFYELIKVDNKGQLKLWT